MVLGDDARFSLFSPAASALYLHQQAQLEESMDSISGPFLSIDELSRVPGISHSALRRVTSTRRINRFHIVELADHPSRLRESLTFIPYESPNLITSPSVIDQRLRVDDLLIPFPITDAPQALVERAALLFAHIIDGLFRSTICSMIRIVISGRWEDHPDFIAITVRDCEKRQDAPARIAVLRRGNDGRLATYVPSGYKASSSSVMASAFHSSFAFGFLLHIHLVAPVLLDRPTDKIAVIEEAPRSARFGTELARLFSSAYPWVLRRLEGIWCFGDSSQDVLASAISCQDHAIDRL